MTAGARIRTRLVAALMGGVLPIALGLTARPVTPEDRPSAAGRPTDAVPAPVPAGALPRATVGSRDGARRAQVTVRRPAIAATPSGAISVEPASVSLRTVLGQRAAADVTVWNTGDAPVTVELRNRQTSRPEALAVAPVHTPPAPPRTAWATFDIPQLDPPSWGQLEEMDTVAASWRGVVYMFSATGLGVYPENVNSARRYDPALGAWSQLPAMPVHRQLPAAAVVRGRIYLIGGWGPVYHWPPPNPVPTRDLLASVDVFDIAAGAWRPTSGQINPKPAVGAGVAVVDGRIYLIGGWGDTVQMFDPATNAFRSRAPYPHPVHGVSCGGIAGRVWCAGGRGGSNNQTIFRDAYAYDPLADRWDPLPDLPVGLSESAHTVANGRLVLIGGASEQGVTNRVLAYDPAARAWLDLPAARIATTGGAAACGLFRLAGKTDGTSSIRQAERLPGWDHCNDDGSAVWLAAAPRRFHLAAGQSRRVRLSVTASTAQGIDQPGQYGAELDVRAAVPHAPPPVPIQVSVLPPRGWRQLTGTVLGRNCDGPGTPVSRAVLTLRRSSGARSTRSVLTDGAGRYARWLPPDRYEVTVAADGWRAHTFRLPLTRRGNPTRDVVLEPVNPCP